MKAGLKLREARRITVHGPTGSGKTTFAGELGQATGLPVCELDALFHCHPDWQDATTEEFRASVQAFLDDHPEGWVIEGNYAAVRDLILPRAEVAVWFQLPWVVSFSRMLRRTVRRSLTHETLWGVNHESWRLSFASKDSLLLWGISHHRAHRRSMRASLHEAQAAGTRVVVVRRPRQAKRLLAILGHGKESG